LAKKPSPYANVFIGYMVRMLFDDTLKGGKTRELDDVLRNENTRLTIFSVPKPFTEHIETIQRNAIKSWVRLGPFCEIVLLGNEKGVRQVAEEFGTKFVPHIDRNDYGTPLINDVFQKAEHVAACPLMCYVNADIMLPSDFPAIVQYTSRLRRFLMVGRRWDLDLRESWNFDHANSEQELRRRLAERGQIRSFWAIDYLVCPRGMLGKLPPFAVGRPAWDNWIIYRCRCLRVPVVDATKAVTVIHQSHDYAHIRGGASNTWEGPEAEMNRELAGGFRHIFSLRDATHFVIRADNEIYLRRRFTLPVPIRVMVNLTIFGRALTEKLSI